MHSVTTVMESSQRGKASRLLDRRQGREKVFPRHSYTEFRPKRSKEADLEEAMDLDCPHRHRPGWVQLQARPLPAEAQHATGRGDARGALTRKPERGGRGLLRRHGLRHHQEPRGRGQGARAVPRQGQRRRRRAPRGDRQEQLDRLDRRQRRALGPAQPR